MQKSVHEQLRECLESALLLALLDRGAHTSKVVAVYPDNLVQLTTGKLDVHEIACFVAERLESDPMLLGAPPGPIPSLDEILI
jgi:hypothetical protein